MGEYLASTMFITLLHAWYAPATFWCHFDTRNKIYFLLIMINFISCLDIRLSLGTKLNETNLYPVVINLNEPLIFEINNIDLFCVYDKSGSMNENRIKNLKNALNFLVDALDSGDRLSLIQFSTNAETILDLEYMDSSNKEKAKDLVGKITAGGETNIRPAIKEIIKGITKESTEEKLGRVQSVIVLTDGVLSEDGKNAMSSLLTEKG